MLRMIDVRGPIEALDAVQAIGREAALDFQDYYRDEDSTYSAFLVVYDDTEYGECDMVEQLHTLLRFAGVDATAFRVHRRLLSYPDALEHEWYVAMDALGTPLLALEALGVRTTEQQADLERLREEIRYRVAMATEQAEANFEEFASRIGVLLGTAPAAALPCIEEFGEHDEHGDCERMLDAMNGYDVNPMDNIPAGTPDDWIPDNPNEDGFRMRDFI